MLTPTHQPSPVMQSRPDHQRRPPEALAIPADRLAPARGVVLGTLLSTTLWAAGITLALRLIG